MVTITKNKTKNKMLNLKVFEEAQEAVVKIKTLRKFLSPADLETLEILLDKEAVATISKSVREASSGKFKPIECLR